MYTISLRIYWRFPLAFYLPLLIPFCSLSWSPLLTWNPPCCDRIRPPWSQVARKLIFSSPSLPICSPSVSHSETPTPCGFPKLMRTLLRRHRNSGFRDQHKNNDNPWCERRCRDLIEYLGSIAQSSCQQWIYQQMWKMFSLCCSVKSFRWTPLRASSPEDN
jgi:hypothetical protein